MNKIMVWALLFLWGSSVCEAGLEISNIKIARSRLEQQVFFRGSINNSSARNIQNVSIKLLALSKDLKILKESDPVLLKDIIVNSGKDFEINIKACPFFEVYKLKINFDEKNEKKEAIFHGSDLFNPPQQEDQPKKEDAAIILLSQYMEDGYLKCFVKNSGELNAEDLTLLVKFFNTAGEMFKKMEILLENGKIKNGETKAYNLKMNNLPDYNNYQASIRYSVMVTKEKNEKAESSQNEDKKNDPQSIEYGEFSSDAKVEVAKCRFIKKPGSLEVKARLKNGKMLPIRDVSVIFSILGGKNKELASKTYKFPGSVGPQDIAEFNIIFEGEIIPSNYKYEVKYEEFIEENKNITQ